MNNGRGETKKKPNTKYSINVFDNFRYSCIHHHSLNRCFPGAFFTKWKRQCFFRIHIGINTRRLAYEFSLWSMGFCAHTVVIKRGEYFAEMLLCFCEMREIHMECSMACVYGCRCLTEQIKKQKWKKCSPFYQ